MKSQLLPLDQISPEKLPGGQSPIHVVLDEVGIEDGLAEHRTRHHPPVDAFSLAEHDLRAFRLGHLDQITKSISRELVVRIEKEHECSGCHVDPGVSRAAGAPGVLLMDHADVLVLVSILLEDRRGPIGGAVVDDHDFESVRG
ncbi:MAG: hypothetical protein L0G94_13195 [Brachybacterium sp.]|nr:hypothetical protein [Brachybacterium sp.]